MAERASLVSVTVLPAQDALLTAEPAPVGWWQQYRRRAGSELSSAALEVLEADAQYITACALPGDDHSFEAAAWPDEGIRTGMVIGSVQSGKTASMLAVASMALDRGVDIVVVLAGTRVGLWLQTYQRMLGQLDGSTLDTAYLRNDERLLLPGPEDVLGVQRYGPTGYLKSSKATLALRDGRPIVIVVPKLDEHLNHLARMFVSVLPEATLAARGHSTTLLILDDEADDASVLDSAASDKITPRFIAALWSGSHRSSVSRHPRLLASYVAYTATPQANYLQESHNPLAPRQFSAALRVPGATGDLTPRQLTYNEPRGLPGFYCGGDLYYETLESLAGCLAISSPFPVQQPGETELEHAENISRIRWGMISNAMRHYLVAGAARLLLDSRRLSPLSGARFETLDALKSTMPRPHTMMFHPSVRKDAHFQAAEDLARWALSLAGGEDAVELPEDDRGNPIFKLDSAGLARRLAHEEDAWRDCLGNFEQSRIALAGLPHGHFPPLGEERWPEVRQLLIDEVFPHITLRVLNSDPDADDRPNFEPVHDETGWRSPDDIFTIFVAGNILSRGLTVEGLTTSLFLRSSNEPAADTQMQMQRWFGYRGLYLPFCRVFLHADQLSLFRHYNQRDKALKSLVLRRMSLDGDVTLDGTLVLEGSTFVATSKIETRKVPLSPGPSPQIRLVERVDQALAANNMKLVRDILSNGVWAEIDSGRDVGRIRRDTVSLLELADLLDQLRYAHHDPSPDDELSRRWLSLQHAIGLKTPLFRPPGIAPKLYSIRPQGCPYAIAAYFRLWDALSKGALAPGFHATDKPDLPWSQLDARVVPRFHLAIRSGQEVGTDKTLREAGIRSMERGFGPLDLLNTLWGSRGYGSGGYLGDQLIDYHFHKKQPIPRLQGGQSWRMRGHPGLALFHIVQNPGGEDMVALGLGLPHGGPDHIAALRH